MISVALLGERWPRATIGAGVFPTWQSNGHLLAAFDQRGGGGRLVFWDINRETVLGGSDSGPPPFLSVDLAEHQVLPPMLWTPDGTKLVFSVGMAILEFNVGSRRLDTLVLIGGSQR
jgi:hypothetical protein